MAIDLKSSYISINLDVKTMKVTGDFWGVNGDTGRGIDVYLVSNNSIIVPTTEVVTLYCEKPDGTHVFIDSVVSGNKLRIELTNQIFTAEGQVKAILTLLAGGLEKSTKPFVLISYNHLREGASESFNDFSDLEVMITNLRNYSPMVLGWADAEALRVLAELDRVANEDARVIAETNRDAEENERLSAEADRIASEAIRESNESSRVTVEGLRVLAETARDNAEDERVSSEMLRDSAESDRISAETARDGAEDARVIAESTRETNESARGLAEIARDGAEDLRVIAESTRDTAEGLRISQETGRTTAEGLRVTAENARESNEDSRELAEGLRVTSESARVTAEGLRVTAETAREASEDTRETQEIARVNAETLRDSAETVRESNETTRQSGESNRVNAESLRVTAESNRAIAESARDVNESNRESAEGLRVTAEIDRVNAEIARGVYEPYNALTTYLIGNKVSYNGSSYICKDISVGNLPTDTDYWYILASKGDEGDSAYEVAVAGGFVGTKEEWIASLKGESGGLNLDYTGNAGKILAVNEGETDVELIPLPTPVVNFLGLTDTPDSYVGSGGKVATIKDTEDGIEFVEPFVNYTDGGILTEDFESAVQKIPYTITGDCQRTTGGVDGSWCIKTPYDTAYTVPYGVEFQLNVPNDGKLVFWYQISTASTSPNDGSESSLRVFLNGNHVAFLGAVSGNSALSSVYDAWRQFEINISAGIHSLNLVPYARWYIPIAFKIDNLSMPVGRVYYQGIHEHTGIPDFTTNPNKLLKINEGGTQLEAVDMPTIPLGIPVGGTENQILSKIDSTDGNVEWVDLPEPPTVIDNLTGLIDVPDSYVGQAGKALMVKQTEDGVEFGDVNVELPPMNAMFYSNVVTLGAESSTFEIGIPEFNASTDQISIYQGGIYKSIPEELTVTSTTATKVSGTWVAGTQFDILVVKSATVYVMGNIDGGKPDSTYSESTIDGLIPEGGATGQILSKVDGADYNVAWVNNDTILNAKNGLPIKIWVGTEAEYLLIAEPDPNTLYFRSDS